MSTVLQNVLEAQKKGLRNSIQESRETIKKIETKIAMLTDEDMKFLLKAKIKEYKAIIKEREDILNSL
jgi:hypothetical protein